MPLYRYKCQECGEFDEFVPVDERNSVKCACGKAVSRVYSLAGLHSWPWRWFEHLDTKPILVKSKRQLRDECEKRNLISMALD